MRRGILWALAGLLLSTACSTDVLGGLVPGDASEAQWALDPTVELDPGATEVPLFVQEVECASGNDARGRIEPDLAYGDAEITVTIWVRHLQGDQNCQGNPLTPYLLQLEEPLGERTLVNGAQSEIALRPIEGLIDQVDGDGVVSSIQSDDALPEQVLFIVEALQARALNPEELGDVSDLMLSSDGVDLLLGDTVVHAGRTPGELGSEAAWLLSVEEFEGFAGPFSVLDTLDNDDRALTVSLGAQPHCAGPPKDAPAGLEAYTRVAIEPVEIDSCIAWFVVNLYLDDVGQVRAIQLDLFGP